MTRLCPIAAKRKDFSVRETIQNIQLARQATEIEIDFRAGHLSRTWGDIKFLRRCPLATPEINHVNMRHREDAASRLADVSASSALVPRALALADVLVS